jgi:multidrug efflux pump subunit AcrA (membrane-fusion protein)
MFVRIELGSSKSESSLTVPDGAVREIDSVKYVFVPISKSSDGETFGLRPVETGAKVGLDRIVIKSGVKEGEMIVASGAFFLQSEFVLQNEPEEE